MGNGLSELAAAPESIAVEHAGAAGAASVVSSERRSDVLSRRFPGAGIFIARLLSAYAPSLACIAWITAR
jgi:hypothetical protein